MSPMSGKPRVQQNGSTTDISSISMSLPVPDAELHTDVSAKCPVTAVPPKKPLTPYMKFSKSVSAHVLLASVYRQSFKSRSVLRLVLCLCTVLVGPLLSPDWLLVRVQAYAFWSFWMKIATAQQEELAFVLGYCTLMDSWVPARSVLYGDPSQDQSCCLWSSLWSCHDWTMAMPC